MPQSKSGIWLQLIAAYALNATCAWAIFVDAECKDPLNIIGCVAIRWPMLWSPFLVALCVGWPALLGLTAAAFMRARLTSALYFGSALFWMFLVYEGYLPYTLEDAADACLVLLGLNLVWLPISIILAVVEAWLKKKIGKRPAGAAGTAGVVP